MSRGAVPGANPDDRGTLALRRTLSRLWTEIKVR